MQESVILEGGGVSNSSFSIPAVAEMGEDNCPFAIEVLFIRAQITPAVLDALLQALARAKLKHHYAEDVDALTVSFGVGGARSVGQRAGSLEIELLQSNVERLKFISDSQR